VKARAPAPPDHQAGPVGAAHRVARDGAGATLSDGRPEALAQRELAAALRDSPYLAAQRRLRDAVAASPYVAAQRQSLVGAFGDMPQDEFGRAPSPVPGGVGALYSNPSPLPHALVSSAAPVQRATGFHVVTSAPEPVESKSRDSDSDEDIAEVQLRKKPNGAFLDDPVFVPVGLGVEVLEEQDDWARVSARGQTGWMETRYLTPQPEPPEDDQDKLWSEAQGEPFGPDDDDPALDDVRQGNLNNCFFLAPLAAIADTPDGPAFIRRILQDAGLGKYRVSFHDVEAEDEDEREDVIVDNWFPTDTEGAFLYSPAGEDPEEADFPTWSAIFEKAYAAWGDDEEAANQEEGDDQEGEEDDERGYAGSENGVAAVALANLLGVVPRSLSWNVESPVKRTL
jgi:hypothetical protein